jgi:hypothetical protein
MKRVCLLALVLATAGLMACGGKQDKGGTQSQPATEAGPSGVPPQLAALLPSNTEVPGWTPAKPPRAFTVDTLYELINGAADGFITYGVQRVVAADYSQAGTGDEVAVEIYQMKDALNAFGKYSEERSPENRFLAIGHEGYTSGGTVNFWTGQYYVKMTAFEEKDSLTQEMVALARAIAAKVPAPGTEPRELSWFPREGQLPHTGKYIPRDVLAQSFLTNGFEVQYGPGPKPSRLTLVGLESAAAATDALARYRQAVAKGASDVRDLTAPGDGGFFAKDGFYGQLVAVRAGSRLAVALGVASEAAGTKQVAELLGNIE